MPVKKIFENGIAKAILKYKYVIVIAVVGLLLLAWPASNSGDSESPEGWQSEFSLSEFEQRVERALTSCSGVGRAKVILTVKSGPENVYAREERQSHTSKENDGTTDESSDQDTKPSILSVGSGKEEPVVVKQMYPKFQGAVIVCDGADDISVRGDVTEAVASLTGLTSDKISVIKMKN